MADAKTDAQTAAEKAVSEARNLKDEADGTIAHYRNRVETLHDDFITEVRQRPLRTLGLAVMIGFALGALYRI